MLRNIKEIEMKNISVLIEGSGKKFKFKKPIVTYGTRIAAKEVTVFWNFKNITSTIVTIHSLSRKTQRLLKP